MKIETSKVDIAVWVFLIFTFGWLMGRLTEAIALGNL